MAVDYGILSQFKTVNDYDNERKDRQLKEQLVNAQIKKANELDLDKIGETAFAKIVSGAPLESLSPAERAGAQWVQNKSGGQYIDTMGNAVQKPKIFDNIAGFSGSAPSAQPTAVPSSAGLIPTPKNTVGQGLPMTSQAKNDTAIDLFGGASVQPDPQKNEWDLAYEEQMRANEGKPVIQKAITEAYAKSKLSMAESEQKNASAADRMAQSQPSLEKPENVAAYSNLGERTLDFINPFGDQLNSSEYKSYNQARKNVSEARLRAVSGAVIGDTEYVNENATLYPQVGDSPELLAQKAANRAVIQRGLARGAGPAYKPAPVIQIPPAAAKAKAGFEAKKGGVPSISSPQDPAFQSLPSGAKFVGPDGVTRVKH